MTHPDASAPSRRLAIGLIGSALILGGSAPLSAEEPLDAAALADGGSLGDVWLGPADAKVTVVEYASLTCGHCAAFSTGPLVALRRDYVETGKVRYVLREYPLDPLAVAAAMLARCRGPGKYYATVEALFATQAEWAFTQKPLEAIRQAAANLGIDAAGFDACLKDQALYDGVLSSRERASKRLGVNSTPTFFVNGTRHVGGFGAAGLDAVLGPMLR